MKFQLAMQPRYTDPPEFFLFFEVGVAPPTYVTCQVDGTPVDVADLSREVTSREYLPSSTDSPVTNVTVTLRTRQAGNYQCTVSVFRTSGKSLSDENTLPVCVSGEHNIMHNRIIPNAKLSKPLLNLKKVRLHLSASLKNNFYALRPSTSLFIDVYSFHQSQAPLEI